MEINYSVAHSYPQMTATQLSIARQMDKHTVTDSYTENYLETKGTAMPMQVPPAELQAPGTKEKSQRKRLCALRFHGQEIPGRTACGGPGIGSEIKRRGPGRGFSSVG